MRALLLTALLLAGIQPSLAGERVGQKDRSAPEAQHVVFFQADV